MLLTAALVVSATGSWIFKCFFKIFDTVKLFQIGKWALLIPFVVYICFFFTSKETMCFFCANRSHTYSSTFHANILYIRILIPTRHIYIYIYVFSNHQITYVFLCYQSLTDLVWPRNYMVFVIKTHQGWQEIKESNRIVVGNEVSFPSLKNTKTSSYLNVSA